VPRFGVTTFPTDYGLSVVDLARAVEERGLDSIFFNEHTHIPVSRRTAFPGGGELPKEYSHAHDPFVALAATAAVTKRIMLSTGICLVIERDPIVLPFISVFTVSMSFSSLMVLGFLRVSDRRTALAAATI